jgi:phenylpyruvate tautomerase PptA (4-oxalocrotonate tautomerase family)
MATSSTKGTIMPIVIISMRQGKSIEFKNGIHDAIHRALVSAFKIPEWDYNQKINEYNSDAWRIPDRRTDNYVSIEVFVFPGRKKETKKQLYKEITTNLEKLGIEKTDTFILLVEQPMENWGIRGGIPADEVDLGYKTNI